MAEKGILIEPPGEKELIISKVYKPDPCALVIFGATGDLARRKLFPSLLHMMMDKTLPENFAVIGLSFEDKSPGSFRAEIKKTTEKFSKEKYIDDEAWERFASLIHYIRGEFMNPDTFAALNDKLKEVHEKFGTGGNCLYFFATPASVFETILTHLNNAGLLYPDDSPEQTPWSRIIIEKPFGRDLESAKKLNRRASEFVDESRIFRIDHYLGKETVQNIIVFRFGNSIFEPIWNRKYIDYVQITAAEDIGIEERGLFYDETGVIRDIIQNHLMQVLALCAMESPVSFKADDIRNEKTKVFRSLRPISSLDVKDLVIHGQYRGYRDEPDVAPDSRTPTYAALKVMIDNWRWQGVPFYLRAGKRLRKRLTEVSVFFQEIPFCLFGGEKACSLLDPNVLTFRIQPDEGITLNFTCKFPGDDLAVNNVLMDFSYAKTFQKEMAHEAYERLFLDAMRGDQTLFARADGVELEWSFITPIINAWESGKEDPYLYEPGSEGPKEAEDLFDKPGRFWRKLK